GGRPGESAGRAAADGRRRREVHVRAQSGGCGLPGGLHGAATLMWGRFPTCHSDSRLETCPTYPVEEAPGSRRCVPMATLVQAVRLALHYGEEHLGVTDVFGEDVGPPLGGVFTATQGLKTTWNSPLDERGIIGTAMGIAY